MPSSTTSSEATRVLLVDDNEAMLVAGGRGLTPRLRGRRRGAKRAGGAAKPPGSSSPDVIVLDISMAGMNGFEVATRLRDSGSTAAARVLSPFTKTKNSSPPQRRLAASAMS